jgi:hypothetical protein
MTTRRFVKMISMIEFKTKLYEINSWTILHLPKEASLPLPSRGMVMVEGTINGFQFQAPLEPDGMGSHWYRIDDALSKAAGIAVGDTVTLAIEPSKAWPEPEVPEDLQAALDAEPPVQAMWADITVAARWDWLRWIRGTKSADTRKKRIEVAFSKMRAGERRPCCFNRSSCTVPDVSQGGILIDPEKKGPSRQTIHIVEELV